MPIRGEGLEPRSPAAAALQTPWPGFLDLLDVDAERAWEQFYVFAMKLMQVAAPRRLRQFRGVEREDAIQGVLVHFCDRGFRVLRTYRDQGKPFALWFMLVANHWLASEMDRRSRQEFKEPLPEDPAADFTDPTPGPEQLASDAEVRSAFRRALDGMDRFCRLLLVGALAEGYKPLDLLRVLGWRADRNKELSDKIRQCRKGLMKRLLDQPVDERRIPGLSSSRRRDGSLS
jgi:DNA-directed RNA polymerase specialized sigma24 family protein